MRTRWLWVAALPLVWSASLSGERAAGSAIQAAPPSGQVESFEARIRPILAANCYDCHTDQRMGGLRVDSREALLKGGRSGPAIVPGDPDKSLLIQAVRQAGALKMPKGGVLRPDDVSALAAWIRGGAKWPDAALSAGAATITPAVTTPPAAPTYVIRPEQRAFWSFQPLNKPPVPAVSRAGWAKSDI